MKTIFIAALAGLSMAGSAAAQTAPAEAPTMPLAQGVTAAPDCGGVVLAHPAVCLQTTLVNLQPVFDAYADFLEAKGWISVSTIENGLLLARPRDGGGCDGLQYIAFTAPDQARTPTAPAYLAFAPVPGDICPTAAPAQ
ncbi:MAG: hypothetical protein V4707_00505 [Pseudomonadota bacterium]